jgi:hypothetical protein
MFVNSPSIYLVVSRKAAQKFSCSSSNAIHAAVNSLGRACLPTWYPSFVTKAPATCWNAGRFTSVIAQGSTHKPDGRGDNAAEVSSE